jgi:hypothetical protein
LRGVSSSHTSSPRSNFVYSGLCPSPALPPTPKPRNGNNIRDRRRCDGPQPAHAMSPKRTEEKHLWGLCGAARLVGVGGACPPLSDPPRSHDAAMAAALSQAVQRGCRSALRRAAAPPSHARARARPRTLTPIPHTHTHTLSLSQQACMLDCPPSVPDQGPLASGHHPLFVLTRPPPLCGIVCVPDSAPLPPITSHHPRRFVKQLLAARTCAQGVLAVPSRPPAERHQPPTGPIRADRPVALAGENRSGPTAARRRSVFR